VNKPKAILFDLDDTLLWDKWSIKKAFEETCKVAENRFGIPKKDLEEATREAARKIYQSYETWPFTQNIGINPFEGLWGVFDDSGEDFQRLKQLAPNYQKAAWYEGLRACGVNDMTFAEELAVIFPIERKKHPRLYEETLEVLDYLKGDYKLVLLTNGSPSLQWTKLELTPELPPYFEYIIISGDVGVGKPDEQMFKKALNLLELQSNDVIMVGDNLMTDIKGANGVGIRSVWINHHGIEIDEVKPDKQISRLKELLTLLPQ